MSGTEGEGKIHPAARDWMRYVGVLAAAAVERFPAATLFVVLFALAGNRVASLGEGEGHWRLLFALLAASAAATAVQLALEVRGARTVWRYALPTSAGILIAFAVQRSAVPLVEVTLLLLVALLSVPLAPFLGRRRDGAAYWTFFLWGSAGAVLAFVAVMVTISGLTTALELFRLFFGLGLSFEAYSHVYVTAFGLIGPIFALASLPATGLAGPHYSPDDRLIRLVRPLLEWIAPALLLLQGAVLHLYAPLALLGGDGLLDAAVLSISFLFGVVALRILLHPFLADLAAPGAFFVRIWLWLVPVPLGLILLALVAWVPSTGLDETTYVLAATAAGVVAIVLFQRIHSLRGDVVAMSAVPLAVMLAAAVGPLSLAESVARSQANRIEAQFGEAIRAGEALGEADRRTLRRSVTLVVEFGQTERLASIVGEERIRELAATDSRSSAIVADRLLALLGVPDERFDDAVEEEVLRVLQSSIWSFIAMGEFDAVAPSVPFELGTSYMQVPTDPTLRMDGTVLTIVFGAEEDRVDIAPMIAAMSPEFFNAGDVDLPVTALTTEGGRTVGIRPGYLSVDAADMPRGGRFSLLFHSEDWASLRGD